MRANRTTLDPVAFGLAAGTVAAVVFALCALAVAVAPATTAAVFGYTLHLDFTGIMRPVTFSGFVGGFVCTGIGVGLAFGAAAALYNRLLGGVPAMARADIATRRMA